MTLVALLGGSQQFIAMQREELWKSRIESFCKFYFGMQHQVNYFYAVPFTVIILNGNSYRSENNWKGLKKTETGAKQTTTRQGQVRKS